MIEEIESDVRDLAHVLGRASLDPRVMRAMERVPRHLFVPEQMRRAAYENHALAIGHGQTISQPFIVALMTDLLALELPARVLEIGTGSGYQAAVLAELGARVYSVEVVEELGVQAQHQLAALGYDNVSVRIGDGNRGWPEHAPYDGVIVTAAAAEVPQALLEQLAPGGRMVIPIGERYETQRLILIEKSPTGELNERTVLSVAFVPLVGPGRPAWRWD
ncbi:MAG: protein-L-isoaspartate(D-aspartate) O-methyltransferase [Gammaproteobacteria bacterium]|nr:protein-L-isoaspartate(D-aspartate) O-methyltransferase [Gammaproteobacteria bacterium]